MNKQKLNSEEIFGIVAKIILGIIAISSVLPFALIVIASITGEKALITNGYSFFPKEFSLDAYIYIVNQAEIIFRAYGISIIVTTVGTATSILLTAMLAYPLSRTDFKYRNILSFFIFFTMIFSGGIVPAYIMWTNVFHIKDTLLALILPNYLVNAFNIFLVRNFFANSVPSSLIESAQIDGAGELRIFFKIMLPLSKPAIATIGIFTGLVYWNDWINGLYYITKPRYYGIQNLLVRIMDNISYLKSGSANIALGANAIQLPSTAVRMGLAVIGILPILLIFPLMQKYLIKGLIVGAVKG